MRVSWALKTDHRSKLQLSGKVFYQDLQVQYTLTLKLLVTSNCVTHNTPRVAKTAQHLTPETVAERVRSTT
jgi:hypothetical protein